MKITLSTPSTTSSAVSVTSAIRLSVVSRASMGRPNQAVAGRRGLWAQVRGVDARVGDAEPGHRRAADQMLVDDLGHVGERDAAVPDGLGIDHHRRAVLALIEAPGAIGAYAPLQAALGDRLLEGLVERLGAGRIAAAARMAVLAAVAADEDVPLERGHAVAA